MVRSATEIGLKTRYFGGGMVGLQFTSVKQQLGPKLNGILDYDWWIPAPTMQFSGILEFLKKYQAKAGAAGVDPLGYYLGTWGYAYIQVYGDAIAATKSLDDGKIADYMHQTTFKTIMGDWAYGDKGEWTKSGMLQVQYHDVKDGNDQLDQWRGMAVQTVIGPASEKTGELIYPYEKAK